MKLEVKLSSDYEYYRYLVETINLYLKYTNPDRYIRGREIDLLCWMAVGSDKSSTLKGTAFRDWLMEQGDFTTNDVYRYTSNLVKKKWLAEALLKVTPTGTKDAKETDIDALEGYKFRAPIFDKKRSQLSLEMILNINVDTENTTGKGQSGNGIGNTNSVPDSSSRAVLSTM